MGKISSSITHRFKKILEATLGQLIGRSINFLIPFVLLHLYIPSKTTDAFFLAFSIAFFFFGTIANTLTDASIPQAVRGQPLLKTWLRLQLGIFFAVIAVGIVWVANHINNASPPLTLLLGIGAMVIGAVFAAFSSGVLSAQESYIWPGMLWGLRALPLLAWWFVHPSDQVLGWLMLALGGADLLRAYYLEQMPRQSAQIWACGYWNSLKGYFPVIVAGMIGGLNPVVDRFIATQADAGGVSLLEAGERFYGALATLATIGVMNVILVKLSHKHDRIGFEQLYQSILGVGALWAVGWTLLGLVGWIMVGEWLIKHFFRVDAGQATLIDTIYLYYLAGLPAFVLGLICVRAYLAKGWQRSLIVLSFLSVGANAGLSLELFKFIGIPGISLATTAVYTLITLSMLVHLSQLSRAIPFDNSQSSH